MVNPAGLRYGSLAALVAAYESGELSRTDEGVALVVDNDTSYVYDGDVKVFRGGGPQDLAGAALDLLGVPWVQA